MQERTNERPKEVNENTAEKKKIAIDYVVKFFDSLIAFRFSTVCYRRISSSVQIKRNGKNYTFQKHSVCCSLRWPPMTTTITGTNTTSSSSRSNGSTIELVTKCASFFFLCLNGILKQTRSKMFSRQTIEFGSLHAHFFRLRFKRITCFQLISLIIRPTQMHGMVWYALQFSNRPYGEWKCHFVCIAASLLSLCVDGE